MLIRCGDFFVCHVALLPVPLRWTRMKPGRAVVGGGRNNMGTDSEATRQKHAHLHQSHHLFPARREEFSADCARKSKLKRRVHHRPGHAKTPGTEKVDCRMHMKAPGEVCRSFPLRSHQFRTWGGSQSQTITRQTHTQIKLTLRDRQVHATLNF